MATFDIPPDHISNVDEWLQIRLGKVTASRVADALRRTKTGWSKDDVPELDYSAHSPLSWLRQAGVLLILVFVITGGMAYHSESLRASVPSPVKMGFAEDAPSVSVKKVSANCRVNAEIDGPNWRPARQYRIFLSHFDNAHDVAGRSRPGGQEYLISSYGLSPYGVGKFGFINRKISARDGRKGVPDIGDFVGNDKLLAFWHGQFGKESHTQFWPMRSIEFVSRQPHDAAGNGPQSERKKSDGEGANCGDRPCVDVERNGLASHQNSDAGKGALLFLGGLVGMFFSYAMLIRRSIG